MERLEMLKKELEIVKSLRCLSYNLKEEVVKYYEIEIKCIEGWGEEDDLR